MSSFVQHLGQPQQNRWAERTARGQGVEVGGHVLGRLLQEPSGAADRDRHRRLQRRVRVGGAEERQGLGDPANGGVIW
jgi:hypothetical protein